MIQRYAGRATRLVCSTLTQSVKPKRTTEKGVPRKKRTKAMVANVRLTSRWLRQAMSR